MERAVVGQQGGRAPFTPVSYEDQKRALQALEAHFFAANAFDAPEDLFNHLQAQRRGFDHFGVPEDPRIHERALTMHRDVLDHLLHPSVHQRLTDSRLYGNRYSVAEFMEDLTDAVFRADLNGDVNTFRQNLQIEFTKRLITMIGGDGPFDSVSKSSALRSLERIAAWMSGRDGWFDSVVHGWTPDGKETAAHRRHVAHLIRQAIDR